MAFSFAYTLDGGVSIAKDFPLDTATNYKTNAGTNGVTKGDLVFQSSGLLRRAIATTGAAVGVVEGTDFTGLVAQGQPYAAVNNSFTNQNIDTTRNPNGVAKVSNNKSDAVFRVPVYQGGATDVATNAHIGGSFTIALDAAGDQQVDLNTTTTPCVKVVDFSADGKTVFVQLI